jgi:hypothetical protein
MYEKRASCGEKHNINIYIRTRSPKTTVFSVLLHVHKRGHKEHTCVNVHFLYIKYTTRCFSKVAIMDEIRLDLNLKFEGIMNMCEYYQRFRQMK